MGTEVSVFFFLNVSYSHKQWRREDMIGGEVI